MVTEFRIEARTDREDIQAILKNNPQIEETLKKHSEEFKRQGIEGAKVSIDRSSGTPKGGNLEITAIDDDGRFSPDGARNVLEAVAKDLKLKLEPSNPYAETKIVSFGSLDAPSTPALVTPVNGKEFKGFDR